MNDEVKGCCGPSSGAGLPEREAAFHAAAQSVPMAAPEKRAELKRRLILIKGGFFDMGSRKSRYPDDLDSPRRRVKVSPFKISPHTVTNRDYAEFVAAAGYRTVAEQEGWSYVFHLFLDKPAATSEYAGNVPWWRAVAGATWFAPEGPGSDWKTRADHPAIHLAWYDALAYCNWAGLRLPRECEWEIAARGGLAKKKFPWGNEMIPGGNFAMNTWQGRFPDENTGEDGWIGTAPVNSFEPNGFGLYNMTGNVWEWVNDFWGDRPLSPTGADHDPSGPRTGYARVQRGGSYLCHVSYCDRYHVHSRTRNDPDSSTGNCGFRVAADE